MQATLQAHRVEMTLQQDGTLTLEHLPFQAGESVEVIILPGRTGGKSARRYPLRGTAVRYEHPLAPVAQEDWDASQ